MMKFLHKKKLREFYKVLEPIDTGENSQSSASEEEKTGDDRYNWMVTMMQLVDIVFTLYVTDGTQNLSSIARNVSTTHGIVDGNMYCADSRFTSPVQGSVEKI